jgi:hypothetical protein
MLKSFTVPAPLRVVGLALFVASSTAATSFAQNKASNYDPPPAVKMLLQRAFYGRVQHMASTPIKIGDHEFELYIDAKQSQFMSPIAGGGHGLVSGVLAIPPDIAAKVLYLVFQNSQDAEAFLTPPTDPTANPRSTIKALIPDGVMRSSLIRDTKNRFTEQLSCYFVHAAAKPLVLAMCAYHPTGSAVVATVSMTEEIKSSVSPDYTGSTDTKNVTVYIAGAIASKLAQFTSSEESNDKN